MLIKKIKYINTMSSGDEDEKKEIEEEDISDNWNDLQLSEFFSTLMDKYGSTIV